MRAVLGLAARFAFHQTAQKEREVATAANERATTAKAAQAVAEEALYDLSIPVGFRDESIVGSDSNIEGVTDAIQTMKDAFGMGETVDTLEETVNPAIAAFNARNSQVQMLQSRISVLTEEKKAADDAASAAASELRDQIRTLEKDKKDAADLATGQISTLESDLAARVSERNELAEKLNARLADNDLLTVKMANQKSEHEARTTQLQKDFKEFKTRFETPDRAVVAG